SRASVFYYCRRTRRYLRSFPTRRSSDLILLVAALSLVSLLVGWWSASRVMSPVSELAKRLSRSGEGGLSAPLAPRFADDEVGELDRKSTRLNSSHVKISYAVFCLKKKNH